MIDDGGDGGEDELTVSAQSLKLRTVQYNRRLPITAAGARGNLPCTYDCRHWPLLTHSEMLCWLKTGSRFSVCRDYTHHPITTANDLYSWLSSRRTCQGTHDIACVKREHEYTSRAN